MLVLFCLLSSTKSRWPLYKKQCSVNAQNCDVHGKNEENDKNA